MADVEGQSTDRLPGDTSKYTSRELYRGSITITTSAVSVGYAATGTVDLSFIDTGNIIPEFEINMDVSSGGIFSYQKVPFTTINTSGLASRAAWYSVNQDTAKGGGYTLSVDITLYDRSSAIVRTFYYKVMSTESGPSVFGEWV